MSRNLRRNVGLLLAFGALAASTACVHVSQRALYNGQAMQQTWQYRAVMNGERNFSTVRGMYWSSNALRLGQPSPRPYTPFTNF